jgi:N-acetyl-anhydromuramyl-L-alanine amidase AmpD
MKHQIQNQITKLLWHREKKWHKRELSIIKNIIVHQELAEGSVKAVNYYHIMPNHISDTGCPHFCYHFGIEKDGTIIQANELTDITWHTSGQNKNSIGIMLVGDFTGPGHIGESEPTDKQLQALRWLIIHLTNILQISRNNVFGHCDFGKLACPGNIVMNFLKNI